jgi:hypothetical protein
MAGVLLILCAPVCATAHDPSSYGGLFRSRNLGATWLNADVGLFVNAALTVAPDPRDDNHLLLGTDSGLASSLNGGRSWTPESRDVISGPVFAIAFSPSGEDALCAATSGVYRYHDGLWTVAETPPGAAPARAIAFGARPGRVYLLGDHQLFASDDGGRGFRALPGQPSDGSTTTALAVATRSNETLLVVDAGRLMASDDGGTRWHERRIGDKGAPVDTAVLDPASPTRLWAASADQIFVSDDLGLGWRAAGRELPEPGTSVRGIAADATASTIVVTTHRGMYRSEDGGANWRLKEGNLPIHLEAGPMARDAGDPNILYAVYSLVPYPEVWRTALEGSNLLARTDPLSLAGGLAFILLLIVGGGLLVVRLDRRRSAHTATRAARP